MKRLLCPGTIYGCNDDPNKFYLCRNINLSSKGTFMYGVSKIRLDGDQVDIRGLYNDKLIEMGPMAVKKEIDYKNPISEIDHLAMFKANVRSLNKWLEYFLNHLCTKQALTNADEFPDDVLLYTGQVYQSVSDPDLYYIGVMFWSHPIGDSMVIDPYGYIAINNHTELARAMTYDPKDLQHVRFADESRYRFIGYIKPEWFQYLLYGTQASELVPYRFEITDLSKEA